MWPTPEKADKAIKLVETVLEAGAGRADKAIDLVETVLEAGAGQAEEAEGPRFESKLHLWPTPKNLTPNNLLRLLLIILSIHRLRLYKPRNEATKKLRDPGSSPRYIKTYSCL